MSSYAKDLRNISNRYDKHSDALDQAYSDLYFLAEELEAKLYESKDELTKLKTTIKQGVKKYSTNASK